MSDSPDGLGSPNSPAIIRDGAKTSGVETDLSVIVERRIWNLIQLLSNCVGDLSKEKQITNKKMEDHSKALKECLADIETDLTAQLKIMEESLMSTDFNCCRALYDHQIETMDEMYSGMKKFLGDAVQRKDLDAAGIEDENYPSDEKEEIDPADFPAPVLSMDPRHIGKSILRHDEDPAKNEDEIFRVRFDKVVRKRLFKAPAEEYEYPELYRLSEKMAFHKALKARNIDVDELWESEGLLRAEGFALLAGAENVSDDEEQEEEQREEDQEMDDENGGAASVLQQERPPSPKTDEARELEAMIGTLKKDYQASKKKYEECKEMLDKNEETAPEPKAVDLLKVEVKKLKLMLRTAIERRNELRNWTDEDLKQRRKDKLARKLLETHKKPRRIEAEKPKDYMSSSSSDSDGPGSVQSSVSLLSSDSSELSPISEISSEEDQQDSGEAAESNESATEKEGDFSMPEDESSLQQPPSSTAKESPNEEEDVEMGEE